MYFDFDVKIEIFYECLNYGCLLEVFLVEYGKVIRKNVKEFEDDCCYVLKKFGVRFFF